MAGRLIARSHYEAVADRRSGLSLGDRVQLGRNPFTVVGLTENQVSSSGDPIVYMTLRDSQKLQFELAPSAARREAARGSGVAGTNTVNAIVARVSANVRPDAVAESARRWKHLAAMTQVEQENVLTRSVVERARKQIGLFTAILLAVSAVIIALIVQQALAMGVIGFGFGAVLINLIKGYFPRRVILQPADGLALAAIVLIVCVLASALGVRLALKVDPGEALKG